MSRATATVQGGDFAVRIPVRRRDQLGALQRSFNDMTANLEGLVATASQKEALEKELALAREVQNSLIPQQLPAGRGIEFATVFEPSAAIGGDYFDILSLPDGRIAVIIADVAGHGLSSGLRMAMLKAALFVASEDIRDPEEIFARLDRLVRSEQSHGRAFVTATLALLSLEDRTLEITNAGHPPTYLLRGGAVEEIVLPSSPLGGLGRRYARKTLPVAPGDTLVWLSDGLIEATNAAGEPFGYDGVLAALAGDAPSAAVVKDRLMASIARHTGGAAPGDDRTMVVLHYVDRGEPQG
jgi:sigma-B regulation protein RsbU (phosphoserine phosphatase)